MCEQLQKSMVVLQSVSREYLITEPFHFFEQFQTRRYSPLHRLQVDVIGPHGKWPQWKSKTWSRGRKNLVCKVGKTNWLKSSAARHALWISSNEWKLNVKPCTLNKTSSVSAIYRSCRGVITVFLTAITNNLTKRSRWCNVPSSIAPVVIGPWVSRFRHSSSSQAIKFLSRFLKYLTSRWNWWKAILKIPHATRKQIGTSGIWFLT